MNAVSIIPTESLSGCVIRQLYHGRPHLVFVQHANGRKPRAVFEVARNGPGGYKPIRPRMDWQDDGDNDDAMQITAEYLKKVVPT